MLKLIVLFFASLIGFTSISPSYIDDHIEENQFAPQRNYRHTEHYGYTDVTYKYETNEVNSADDFVVGNIYHCSLVTDTVTSFPTGQFFWAQAIYNFGNTDNLITLDTLSDYTVFIYKDINSLKFGYLRPNGSVSYFTTIYISFLTSTFEFDFVFSDYNFSSSYLYNNYSVSSSTEFNVIESVIYNEPTSVFGYLSEVLGNSLFGGIPNVDNVIFNVGGQDITLKSWLVTTTCIVLAILTIILLILFIRFLFKLFANRLWH